MASNTRLIGVALLILFPRTAPAQFVSQHALDVRFLNDEQTQRWVVEALSEGLPDYKIDELDFLALNHQPVVIPLLENRLMQEVGHSAASQGYARKLSDALSYTASRAAISRFACLVEAGEQHFGYYIGRTLDYAVGRGNPYQLVYDAVDLGSRAVTDRVIKWVEQSISSSGQSRQAQLLAAAANRQGRPISKEFFDSDPVLSRLHPDILDSLRQRSTQILPK